MTGGGRDRGARPPTLLPRAMHAPGYPDEAQRTGSPLKSGFEACSAAAIPASRILGVPVSLVGLPAAVRVLTGWARIAEARFVCIRDVHGVMLAQDDADLRAIHDAAGMVTPDGMPLVWTLRARGHAHVSRACGADLVEALCAASVGPGLRHYFYGGRPGVAERMAAALVARHPGLQVVDTASPPFGQLDAATDAALTAAIVTARPHFVWVGLGTPRQEYWMRDHVGQIPGATLIGVGAAFDFLSGDISRAPRWMQRSGAEWLYRLCREPRRLWRRYLVLGSRFLVRLCVESWQAR